MLHAALWCGVTAAVAYFLFGATKFGSAFELVVVLLLLGILFLLGAIYDKLEGRS